MKTAVRFLLILAFLLALASPPGAASAAGVFTVRPNGTDDTASLKAAFDRAIAAGPGSTVQLVKGDYKVGLLDIRNFDGYFKGAGMGKTVLHALTQLDCQSLVDQNIVPSLIIFRHGNPRIQDLTISIDDPAPCAAFSPAPWWTGRTSLETALLLTGNTLGKDNPCDLLGPDYAKGSVTRVEIKTPLLTEVNYDQYVIWGMLVGGELVWDVNQPCYNWVAAMSGDYLITDSVFSVPVTAGSVSPGLFGGTMRIQNNTFTGSIAPIDDYDANGTLVVISGNTIKYPISTAIEAMTNKGVLWSNQPPATKPATFLINHNTIYLDNESNGIVVEDWPNRLLGVPTMHTIVSQNHIYQDGPGTWGIMVEAIDHAVVNQNTVEGKGHAGILMNPMTYYGYSTTPMTGSLVTLNDVSKFQAYDPENYLAPILLGTLTSHCTVIGANVTDTVLDAGTHNTLINVKTGFLKSLQAVFSQSLQKKLENLQKYQHSGRPGGRR